jgi:hypothetical protein
MKDDKLKNNLNSSGFPFQIAVESIISNISGWKVSRREYPWHNNDKGQNGFIDIIAEKSSVALVIECKRVRDAEWIFLCSPRNMNRSHARFWVNKVAGREEAVGWYDGQVEPSCPEAEFCAVMGQDHRKPLLENLASELTSATEAFAVEELPFFKGIPMAMCYFPVIITTAELYVCKYDPSDIEIKTGEIKNPIFEPVPFVRFRKSLTTSPTRFATERNIARPEDLAEAKERTVFILNASSMKAILADWEIAQRSIY